MASSTSRDVYGHVDIHLCKHCGGEFEPGQEVVCRSDGYVDGEMRYEVDNRRFFHRECWIEYINEHMDASPNDSTKEGGDDADPV